MMGGLYVAEHLAFNNDERKQLFDGLTEAIDKAGLSLNEFIFATSDLLKTTFWVSLTAELGEQETNEMRERISKAVEGTVDVLDETTNNVGEDIIVLTTVLLEAVNHVLKEAQEDEEGISVEE